jgi:hypothetical protein
MIPALEPSLPLQKEIRNLRGDLPSTLIHLQEIDYPFNLGPVFDFSFLCQPQ